MIDFCYKNSSISIFSCGTLCKWSQSYSATDYSQLWKMFHNPYENYPILIYDMTIISLVVFTGVYPNLRFSDNSLQTLDKLILFFQKVPYNVQFFRRFRVTFVWLTSTYCADKIIFTWTTINVSTLYNHINFLIFAGRRA